MLETIRRYLRYTSWPIIAAMIAMMAVGVMAIQVAEEAGSAAPGYVIKQATFAAAGVLVFFAVTLVPYHRIGRLAYPLFAVTLVMLVVVLFLPARRSAHRWIGVGERGIQPSEVAKLAYIILLAWYLRYGDHYRRLRGLIVPFVLTFVPMGLILIEPDLGTCLLFLPTLYFMLFMAGAKLRHLLGIVAVATAVVLLPVPRQLTPDMGEREIADRKSLAYGTVRWSGGEYAIAAAPLAIMEHHQVRRIDGWLRQGNPDVANDTGYQLRKSKMILGAGMWGGRGHWRGPEPLLPMPPDAHTDFIFSVIGAEWGFLGCVGLLALYVVVFVFGIEIAVVTYDPFGRLLAVGALAMLFSQLFINVGMTMGLMPITGMTLPLVSYGGSSLVVNCAALGLLVNVGQRRPILLGRRPFEHGRKKEKPPAPYGLLGGATGLPDAAPPLGKAGGNTPTR